MCSYHFICSKRKNPTKAAEQYQTHTITPQKESIMGWFFSNSNKHPQEESESFKEKQLLSELPPEIATFYTSTTNHQLFKFKETNFEANYQQPSLSESSAVVCADFQSEFINCITHGSWKEKLTGCNAQMKKLERCMDFQKQVLEQLGLKYVGNKVREERVLNAADSLGLKWLEAFKDRLSAEVVDDILVEREKIWGISR